jgi:preprotein translocase subunit YajC
MLDLILLDIPKAAKTVIMIVLMIVVFYFFLIRPGSQKAKKEREYRDNLQKGDKLMTTGGIHVTFVSREGSMAIVEAAPGARMKVQIGTLQPIPEHKEK